VVLPRLELESGEVLLDAPIAFASWGRLNRQGDNAVVVCHALTGSADATEWWQALIGPGKALDTERFFVICLNTLGSPYGSASPVTIEQHRGVPYGPDFPTTTVRDTVRAHHAVLKGMGVRRVVAAMGGSMGGMQVLEWGFRDDFVRSLVPVAVGARHSPWCIGWSEAQRKAIRADRRWNGGHYEPDDPPVDGLAAARMMAMMSYRSPTEFSDRFARAVTSDQTFQVASYLRHQGDKLVRRFDANCYISLTDQMDSHDVGRGRGGHEYALRSLPQPTLVIGISSDVLYPLAEQEEIARCIPDAKLAVLNAPYGHDSFLIRQTELGDTVRPFLETVLCQWQ
jgi:homoserine O-acetyltransferase